MIRIRSEMLCTKFFRIQIQGKTELDGLKYYVPTMHVNLERGELMKRQTLTVKNRKVQLRTKDLIKALKISTLSEKS